MKKESLIAVRDSIFIFIATSVVALTVNALRHEGIPLVQKEEYQLFVPCPEVTGDTEGIAPNDGRLLESGNLIIDARTSDEYSAWHYTTAINIPYDYLSPTPKEAINKIAKSGAKLVIVYGDGEEPDSGEELAKEISGKGIRNVYFVRGGVKALTAKKEMDE